MIIAAISIAILIYSAFQTEVLRPVITSTDLFYTVDEYHFINTIWPNNTFPSLQSHLLDNVSAFVYEKNSRVGIFLIL